MKKLPGLEKVTRFEVIDHTGIRESEFGRILVRYFDNDVIDLEAQLQDDGRTLKIFLGWKKTKEKDE